MSYQTERQRFIWKTAPELGLNPIEAKIVLRKAQTLHSWAVHECNGTKQREETYSDGYYYPTGRVYWCNPRTGKELGRTPDLETGALKSMQAIANAHGLKFVHQGDPRGWVVSLVKDGREYGVPSRG